VHAVLAKAISAIGIIFIMVGSPSPVGVNTPMAGTTLAANTGERRTLRRRELPTRLDLVRSYAWAPSAGACRA